MNLLLDSHVFIWWLTDDKHLGPVARQTIREAERVSVSVVTVWEMGIKAANGHFDPPSDLADAIGQCGFETRTIDLGDTRVAPSLPLHHKDPFDRMLIAQALNGKLTIVTSDAAFSHYGVPLREAKS